MTRILLCDDNENAQEALERISRLREEDGGEALIVTRQARTARASLRHLFAARIDAVLIDLFLPIADSSDPAPPSGAWLTRAIARAFDGRDVARPLLLLWTSNIASTLDVRNECRAFRHHGGQHIIDKQDRPEAQLKTFEAALAGRTWEPPADGLTPAEREVLAYYAAGFEQVDIARRTFRAHRTIEGTVNHIRHKLLAHEDGDAREWGRGAGPVIAAAAMPGSTVSWLPIEHLGEPPRHFRAIDERETSA